MSLSNESGRVKTFQAFPFLADREYRARRTRDDDSKIESEISIIVIAGDAVQVPSANSSSSPGQDITRRDLINWARAHLVFHFDDAIFLLLVTPGYIYDSDGKWNRRFYERSSPPIPRYPKLTTNLEEEREREKGGCVCHLSSAETIKMFRAIGEKGLVAAIRPRQSFSSRRGLPRWRRRETRVKRIDSGRPINSSHSANNVVR